MSGLKYIDFDNIFYMTSKRRLKIFWITEYKHMLEKTIDILEHMFYTYHCLLQEKHKKAHQISSNGVGSTSNIDRLSLHTHTNSMPKGLRI